MLFFLFRDLPLSVYNVLPTPLRALALPEALNSSKEIS